MLTRLQIAFFLVLAYAIHASKKLVVGAKAVATHPIVLAIVGGVIFTVGLGMSVRSCDRPRVAPTATTPVSMDESSYRVQLMGPDGTICESFTVKGSAISVPVYGVLQITLPNAVETWHGSYRIISVK